jgi:hypothetical protein
MPEWKDEVRKQLRGLHLQRGRACLVSLEAIFECYKLVVPGTHRSDSGATMRLRAVGIPGPLGRGGDQKSISLLARRSVN